MLSTTAEAVADPFRRAAAALATSESHETRVAYDRIFGARDVRLGTSARSGDARLPWAVLGMYAVEVSARRECLTLGDAERAFLGDSDSLVATYSAASVAAAESILASVDQDTLEDLLPYVFDPHGTGTRRAVLRDVSQTAARSTKRRQGIFYTPGDVADFMADQVVAARPKHVLDPACGTGVFLRAVARAKASLGQEPPLSGLYGLDVDPLAIDAACFALAGVKAQTDPIGLLPTWHLARLDLAQRDALTVLLGAAGLESLVPRAEILAIRRELREELTDGRVPEAHRSSQESWGRGLAVLFPEAADDLAVIGNPPYARLGERSDLAELGRQLAVLGDADPTAGTNAFIPFLEYLLLDSGAQRTSSYVIPLAIAYNTTSVHVAARKAIQGSSGRWTFRFFDRTPDSLFGDDIKQRTAIVVREPASRSSVRTTGLQRWTSKRRHELFRDQQDPVDLGPMDITPGIPKIGQPWETILLQTLRSTQARMSDTLASSAAGSALIEVGTTAYNRLAVYRGGGVTSRVDANTFSASDDERADWAFAVLQSSLVYWLWRVQGDGFHVPRGWLLSIPLSWTGSLEDGKLAALGNMAWQDALLHPSVATNAGTSTTSYAVSPPVGAEIDRLVMTRLGASDLVDHLATFRQEMIAVGRDAYAD